MAVNLSPIWGAGAQLLDNSGNVLSGGKIYTYAAGTTTPVTTFTSNTGITANSNPIVLNSAGRVPYEIWLTDGQNYKFVLKDSNDVLIGTWDNLSGINSNFIAYTNQQEIQTATAGQTVFNLTTMNYLPGTNSLSVFVDGVNQYGPGASYAYEETDSNTVTFTSGLHDGAEVKFTSSQIQNAGVADASQITFDGVKGQVGSVAVLGTIDGSDWVGFQPDGTGAVYTDYSIQDKLRQTVSVKDFGAVGDGVTDDTAAIQAAIDSIGIGGGAVRIPTGIYKVTSTINIQTSGISLIGDNQGTGDFFVGGVPAHGSQLKYAGAGNEAVLAVGFIGPIAISSNRSGFYISNINIDGGDSDTAGLNVDGLLIRHGVINSTFENMMISYCKNSVHLYGRDLAQSYNNKFYRCHIQFFRQYGFYIEGDGNGTQIVGCKMANSYLYGASPIASVCIASDPASLEGSKANGVTIQNNSFGSQNVKHHIKTYQVEGLNITGNEIESSGNSTVSADALVHLGDATTLARTSGFCIIGNRFVPNAKASHAINVEYVRGGMICGNSFASNNYTTTYLVVTPSVNDNYNLSMLGNYVPSLMTPTTNPSSMTVLYDLPVPGANLPDYSLTNVSTDRAYDVSTVTLTELANVVGTLINDLADKRLINSI